VAFSRRSSSLLFFAYLFAYLLTVQTSQRLDLLHFLVDQTGVEPWIFSRFSCVFAPFRVFALLTFLHFCLPLQN